MKISDFFFTNQIGSIQKYSRHVLEMEIELFECFTKNLKRLQKEFWLMIASEDDR